jgi:hypothetical protein
MYSAWKARITVDTRNWNDWKQREMNGLEGDSLKPDEREIEFWFNLCRSNVIGSCRNEIIGVIGLRATSFNLSRRAPSLDLYSPVVLKAASG